MEPTIKKTDTGFLVDFPTDAPTIISGEPTKKDPRVKVDMAMRLMPKRIQYDGDFTEEQVRHGLEKTGFGKDCKLCRSTEQAVGKIMKTALGAGAGTVAGTEVAERRGLGLRDRPIFDKLKNRESGVLFGRMAANATRHVATDVASDKVRERLVDRGFLKDFRPKSLLGLIRE